METGNASGSGTNRVHPSLVARYLRFFESSTGSSSNVSVNANAIFYGVLTLFGAVCALCCVIAPFVSHCEKPALPPPPDFPYSNPNYDDSNCSYETRWILLGMTQWEADMGRRILVAIILGAIIGHERRTADRAAGIRLMSVIALGSACFTISSMFCFEASTQAFDAARVAAAIPSGVGFIGSALIWKGFVDEEKVNHQVHGLTTAASVWISAAVGVAAGGELYFCAVYTTLLMVFILRFGPRHHHTVAVDSQPKSKQPTTSTTQTPDLRTERKDASKENMEVNADAPSRSASRRKIQSSIVV
mmetsp:Transcript_15480/g.33377  ORF Transcript_15480/g.33377 Transcript_15480/m.33377 type:complete len:303 (+) Transcript_15480:185-1093(+)